MRQCAKCGTQNAAERDFCTNCGEYLRWDPTGFMPAVPQAPAAPPGAVPPGHPPPPPPPPGSAYPPPGAAYPPPQQPQYIPQAPPPQAAAPVAAEPVVITLRAAGAQAVGPPTVQVEPGATVQLVALVRNQSGIVDNYDLHLEGLPPQWWTISPPTVYLVPYGSGGQGYEQEVTIDLKPPRSPEAEARPWQFQLVAKSKAQGGARVGAGQGTLVIGPFTDFQTDIRPQKGAGRRKATFTITVKNKANAPVEVDLTASESEESHRFEFEDEKDRVTPAPGKSAITRVTVSPPKQRWIGGGKDVRFTVQPQVAGTDHPAVQARATFVHKAWLPQWIMFFFPIAVAMAVGAFFAWKSSQSEPTYTVPELRQIAQSEDGVSKALREAKLELGEVKEEESEDFRPGIVIKQDPEAGDKVKEGTKVNITIAVGSTIQEVPDIVGMTFEEANGAIKEAGFVVGRVQPGEPDPEQPVKSQQPDGGDEGKEGSAVDLFFEEPPEESTAEEDGETAAEEDTGDGEDTAGEEDPQTAGEEDPADTGGGEGEDTGGGEDTGSGASGDVPNLAGKSAEEALNAAKEAGLAAVPTVVISDLPAGDVISQKQEGDQLLLTLSGGYPQLAFDQDGDIFVADGAQGKEPQAIAQSDDLESQPSWNNDGTKIAYRRGADDEAGQIFIVDPADPQSAKALTGAGFDDRRPAFSPDGKVVAFVRGASKDVDHDLCFIGVGSTTGQPSCIEDPAENVSRPDWSPDGQSILVVSSVPDVRQVEATLYTTPTANSAKAGNWTRDSVVTDPMHGKRDDDIVVTAAWSPSGDQVLFVANWGKDFFHAWVAKAENGLVTGRAQPLLKIQACEASWRVDGGEVVFTQRDNTCTQQGSVKRVDPKKPGEQVTLTRLVGASNPTWAPVLPPSDAAPPPEDRPDEQTAEVGEEDQADAPPDEGTEGEVIEPEEELPADTEAEVLTAE